MGRDIIKPWQNLHLSCQNSNSGPGQDAPDHVIHSFFVYLNVEWTLHWYEECCVVRLSRYICMNGEGNDNKLFRVFKSYHILSLF